MNEEKTKIKIENSIFQFADEYYCPSEGVHEVQSWSYVRRIARAALKGEKIPAYLPGYTGTHRAAANDLLELLDKGRLIPTVDLDSDLTEQDRHFFEWLVDAGLHAMADLFLKRCLGACAISCLEKNITRDDSEPMDPKTTRSMALEKLSELEDFHHDFRQDNEIDFPESKLKTKIA